MKEQLVLISHQSFCTCLHILFQGGGGQRFLTFVVIVARTNLASWFQVSKATMVGEVFSTSPILAILLCLLSFHLLESFFTSTFTKHCQTFNEMKPVDFLILLFNFIQQRECWGILKVQQNIPNLFIYLFLPWSSKP